MDGNVASVAAGIGAGICVFGGALGIGKLASAAMDGTARQPAAASPIKVNMVLAASYIEGATLLGLLVCLMLAGK
jgi:F-type H+-transporting ATPase subunit c